MTALAARSRAGAGTTPGEAALRQRVYRHPAYYEIAFSYRDTAAEVGVIESLIERHCGRPVTRVLELGCGHAAYMAALARRGYRYIGLDLDEAMLAHARHNAGRLGIDAELVAGDMLDFRLPQQVDLAFLPLGSLFARSGADLTSHFDSVARVLRPGGLYLLEQCVAFEPSSAKRFAWTASRDGVDVATRFEVEPVSHADQTVTETLSLAVSDRGVVHRLRERWIRRLIYPQEFLALIAGRDDFEFAGWWKNWSLAEATGRFKANNRSLVLVRRVDPAGAGRA